MLTEENLMSFSRTKPELEQFLFFSVAVAGKNSQITMRAVNNLFRGNERAPFAYLARLLKAGTLIKTLKYHGMGQYKKNKHAVKDLVKCGLDLKTCTVEELETLHGIGPKTARFFISFSRPSVQFAILDVHILRWMRKYGIKTPKSTPGSQKRYRELEKKYLSLAKRLKQNPAKLDYKVWLSSRKPVNV